MCIRDSEPSDILDIDLDDLDDEGGGCLLYTSVADIIVYVLNWAYRFGAMGGAVRHELLPYAEQIRATLLYRTQRCDDGGKKWPVSSITYVDDLRGAQERRHCCDTE